MTPPRRSSEAELDALMRVGVRLAGFDPALSPEWIDGALTAIVAGPRVPPGPAEVVDALFSDTWGRTFADPQDVAQALAVLQARWRVLCSQLDPESLWDAPDALRLEPMLLAVPEPAEAAPGRVAGGGEAGEARDTGAPDEAAPRLGEDWARGFLNVVTRGLAGWDAADVPLDTVGDLLAPLVELAMPDPARERAAAPARAAADGERSAAEARVDAACYAAQDLRLWWIEHAPRTAPRRVEAAPGRNDPCPCGSGRKYKKCHGASA